MCGARDRRHVHIVVVSVVLAYCTQVKAKCERLIEKLEQQMKAKRSQGNEEEAGMGPGMGSTELGWVSLWRAEVAPLGILRYSAQLQ